MEFPPIFLPDADFFGNHSHSQGSLGKTRASACATVRAHFETLAVHFESL